MLKLDAYEESKEQHRLLVNKQLAIKRKSEPEPFDALTDIDIVHESARKQLKLMDEPHEAQCSSTSRSEQPMQIDALPAPSTIAHIQLTVSNSHSASSTPKSISNLADFERVCSPKLARFSVNNNDNENKAYATTQTQPASAPADCENFNKQSAPLVDNQSDELDDNDLLTALNEFEQKHANNQEDSVVLSQELSHICLQ